MGLGESLIELQIVSPQESWIQFPSGCSLRPPLILGLQNPPGNPRTTRPNPAVGLGWCNRLVAILSMTSYVQKDRVEEERKAESTSVGLCVLCFLLAPKGFSARSRVKSALYEGNPSIIKGAAYHSFIVGFFWTSRQQQTWLSMSDRSHMCCVTEIKAIQRQQTWLWKDQQHSCNWRTSETDLNNDWEWWDLTWHTCTSWSELMWRSS